MSFVHTQRREPITEERIDRLAGWLELRLGSELTAFSVGTSPHEVNRIAERECEPSEGVEHRLRNLYAVAWYLVTRDGPGSAYQFLIEPSAELGDRAPATLLREGGEPESVWMAAASPF